jgi:hypothetical protein
MQTELASAPHHCPHRLAPESIAAIEQLRRQRQTGDDEPEDSAYALAGDRSPSA